jgi:hypothetical protein
MAGLTNLKLLTDFFNKIGHFRTSATKQSVEILRWMRGGAIAPALCQKRPRSLKTLLLLPVVVLDE